jgi:hypothetical protein
MAIVSGPGLSRHQFVHDRRSHAASPGEIVSGRRDVVACLNFTARGVRLAVRRATEVGASITHGLPAIFVTRTSPWATPGAPPPRRPPWTRSDCATQVEAADRAGLGLLAEWLRVTRLDEHAETTTPAATPASHAHFMPPSVTSG